LYCICTLAFVIRNAARMRHVMLSCTASLDLKYFSTLSHTWHDSRKKLLIITFVF
jgi:hypothetical protein